MKRILVCAYSCISESGVKYVGGEAGLGWNMVKQISLFHEVFVLTHFQNKEAIEKRLKGEPLPRTKFIYVSLPGVFNFMERFHNGGIQVYSYLWQIKAYFVARKLHKENRFDVFHHVTYANDWMASYIGALLPVAYVRGPGGGAHKVPNEFVKTFSAKDRLLQLLRGFGQWVFRHDPFFVLGQLRAKAILVCNKEAFDNIPEKFKEKTYFFPVNGISENEILDTADIISKKPFTILSAGKFIRIKGFDLVLKAFKQFSRKFGGAKLVIVGDGPELKNLEALAQLCPEESVVFKKWIPREELLEEMKMCDLFAFGSLRDGGGAVILEAMAFGKPIVCFDIAGPGFHVSEECGIKIKPETPDQSIRDMALAMEKIYSDSDLRRKMGLAAKERVVKHYTWGELGKRINGIYSHILGNDN